METADKNTINVQEIEPQMRHQTIFDTFDGLKDGEHLTIHNNHDPQPVYYQLLEMYGETFTWEYLQRGPQWWDILVTKINLSKEATKEIGTDEMVLDIPAITDHTLKHQAIFQAFEELDPGKSFVIHNDHDPKPVYFQLQNLFGDIFDWEYIQNGPQVYDIRLTKSTDAPASQSTFINELGETVVDVPAIADHHTKHETIFKVFGNTKPGESFIIHNDHDPKPVYFQLQQMNGDVFTWDYLESGPQFWDIRVTMNGEENGETIGEIVKKDITKSEVFKKYGIDFCCKGNRTVAQACSEMGIDAVEVEKALQKPMNSVTGGNLNFDDWDLGFLADYIVNTHHNYVKKYLPEIVKYSNKVAQVHGPHHPELLPINELVEQVNVEFFSHMDEEENNLFPLVKEVVKAKESNSKYTIDPKNNLKIVVDTAEEEHVAVGDALREIRRLSNDFALPEDACASYTLLFKMLEEFENDTFTHIHLENNMLFPKAQKIEESLA